MKTTPILFTAPMVQALLRDWEPKTQSRRIVKPQQSTPRVPPLTMEPWLIDGIQETDDNGRPCWVGTHPDYPTGQKWFSCPYGRPGDQLWVRETWQINHVSLDRGPIPKTRPLEGGEPVDLIYRADGEFREQFEIDEGGSCWRPSIFMPRWASRISLDLLNIRVERLQDISEADAKAEGVACGWYERDTLDGAECVPTDYRGGFKAAWNTMHEKQGYGWDTSPWVWVLTFKRSEKSE